MTAQSETLARPRSGSISAMLIVATPVVLALICVLARFEIIELSRHTIAHHRPLGASDVARLKLNIESWQKLLRERQHLI